MCGGKWKNRYKSILQYPRPSHSSTANTCKRNEQQTARAYSCAQYLFTVTMAGTVDTQTISLSSWYYNYFYFHADLPGEDSGSWVHVVVG